MQTRLDVILLVPLQPVSGMFMEAAVRQSIMAHLYGPITRAYVELCEYLGFNPGFHRNRPVFDGNPIEFATHRSLGAVTLATHLQQAGLNWRVFDAGMQDIGYWRRQLEQLRERKPRSVAVSTTFVLSGPWLRGLCAEIRRILPDTQIILGGYYYTSNAREFLTIDADVLCVGEGEVRLPAVVRAIRDGAPLDTIPGLYLRGKDGRLTFTGDAEPLDLNQIGPVDYHLAEEIEPPVSLDNDVIEFGLETQRGCVFNCEFCTYRTLSTINVLEVDEAAQRIVSMRLGRRGLLTVTDATATYPHDRWAQLMRRLIELGGSPHPIWTYARVSDISDETAELMARAGVRELFIGQESGDQRILNQMRKGTRVDQVKPAMRALSRNGLTAFISFIHGFPGEDAASLNATRKMISELNQECPNRPVSLWYKVDPFVVFDFAAVAQTQMKGVAHYLGYDTAAFSPLQACSAVLETLLTVSRVPHAPVNEYVLGLLNLANKTSGLGSPSLYTADRIGVYRWLKQLERGIMIFLERELEGKVPNDFELRRIRDSVVAQYPVPPKRSLQHRVGVAAVSAIFGRLLHEWRREANAGVGPLTRASLAFLALSGTGRVMPAIATLARGEYAVGRARSAVHPPDAAEQADILATRLIAQSADAAKRSRKLIRAKAGNGS